MSVSTAETANVPARAGLSWGAIFGGAAAATAVTITLLALGSGLGLASVSPIRGGNPSAITFTALAAVWLIIVQWVSSFFGGYLAGWLRPGWAGVHRDESCSGIPRPASSPGRWHPSSSAAEQAKQAANVARKAASSFAIYTFFSMLIGAFIAGVAAAIGGRQRDAF